MSMLQARGLTLRFIGDQPLFAAVDFDIGSGDRIAVVGPNGAGKSSLLRVLAGWQAPDSGQIIRRRGLVQGCFAQSNAAADGEAICDWPLAGEVEPVLRGLGFDTDAFYTPLAQLSAGQRSRAFLAQALVAPADLLLLDEPTNHLDAKARAWLVQYLTRRQRTCLFVSHEEAFLEPVATRVFALGRGRFGEFAGGYAAYLAHAATERRREASAYNGEQRRLAAFERAAQRRDALSAKVAVTPPGGQVSRPFYARKAAKVARTGRLLRERIPEESRIEKPWEDAPIPRLDFAGFARAGDPPIALREVDLGYGGAPVVAGLNLTVRRGERWVLRGPNGAGKTSVFRAIRGELAPERGQVALGVNVSLGYYAQEAETLDPSETPLEACLRVCADVTWIRTLLACLHLPRPLAQTPIGQLSLGERAKTALVQVLVSGANVLLLDEPTNHLEIETRRALIETLAQYPGTIVFTSHDEAFVDAIATHTLALGV